MHDDEPFWNAQRAADYLGFDTAADRTKALKNFYDFVRRHRVPKYHRGSVLLFRQSDLNRAVGADDKREVSPIELRMMNAQLPEKRRA